MIPILYFGIEYIKLLLLRLVNPSMPDYVISWVCFPLCNITEVEPYLYKLLVVGFLAMSLNFVLLAKNAFNPRLVIQCFLENWLNANKTSTAVFTKSGSLEMVSFSLQCGKTLYGIAL